MATFDNSGRCKICRLPKKEHERDAMWEVWDCPRPTVESDRDGSRTIAALQCHIRALIGAETPGPLAENIALTAFAWAKSTLNTPSPHRSREEIALLDAIAMRWPEIKYGP